MMQSGNTGIFYKIIAANCSEENKTQQVFIDFYPKFQKSDQRKTNHRDPGVNTRIYIKFKEIFKPFHRAKIAI